MARDTLEASRQGKRNCGISFTRRELFLNFERGATGEKPGTWPGFRLQRVEDLGCRRSAVLVKGTCKLATNRLRGIGFDRIPLHDVHQLAIAQQSNRG